MFRPLRTAASILQPGFSLVELTIVVVILGVLAMVGIPKYYQVTERSKAAEAFSYLQHVSKAQAMYKARHGIYAKDLGKLRLGVPPLKFFEVGRLSGLDWEQSWQLRLRRSGASQGYGNYTVAWNQDGFAAERSSIAKEVSPIGMGGKLVASGSSRGNARPRTRQPTGSLEWDRGESQSFGDYRDRMFEANSLD